MRWRVIVFLAAGWLAAAPGSSALAQDSTPHQAEYLKIYLKINDADQLERKGDYRGALADFKDCYARLLKIHNADPSWESALVIHRMEDCKAKILYLADEAAQQPATSPEPSPAEDNGAPLPPTDSGTEVQTLRQQLNAVQQELEDARAKLQNSQLEVTNLHSQLDAVNQELAALKSGESEDARMGALLSENKKLQDKLADAQKEIAEVRPLNPHSALALARTQLKNTEDKLAASEAANTALQQTTSTLQTELDHAQADLRSANERLAAAPPSSPEYDTLKRENEVMRDILTRELQEQAHRDMAKRLAQEEFDRLKITSKVLQEQLDILGSPMTPPTTDQERVLIDSLRTPPAQVATVPAEGNGFAASNSPIPPPSTNSETGPAQAPETGMAPDTNAPAASTNAAPTQMAADTNAPAASTNAAPTQMAADTNTPAAATNATTVQMASDTNTPPATDTNAPPVTVVTPTAPSTMDTNAPAGTNMASPSAPGPENPASPSTTTNMAATTTTETAPSTNAPSTNAAPEAPAMTADTNGATPPATTNMAAATTDTNAAPGQVPAPNGTTTYQETVVHNGGDTDAAEYSSKPRLPDDMRDTAQQAADLFKMQRYDEAAAKYQSIIEKYPDSLYAWSNLGVVRFQQGKLPEALKALQQAVKLSPTDAFSYSNLGIVYYQSGNYDEAISALERALALDPTNAMSHNYLGCACSQKGWQEVAEKEFTKAIELNDNFADAHFNLALIYATEKPPALEMARRHYKRALELGIQPDPRLEKLLQLDVVSPASGIK